nr:feather beta keratin-like isoform X1 [Anser cygnoides]
MLKSLHVNCSATRSGCGEPAQRFLALGAFSEGREIYLHPAAMSCYDLCPSNPCGPTPLANSCNEPCVRQCQDSTYVIQPSPVVVTLPGPILSSFPQNTTVGSSASAAVGDALSAGGVPISSGSSLGLGGLGYSGLGGLYGRSYRRYNRRGSCGPC